MTVAQQLLKDLFREIGAYKQAPPGQPFKLASGKESNFYVDCRQVVLTPRGSRWTTYCMIAKIMDYLAETNRETSKIYLGATGVGGCPLLGAILFHMGEASPHVRHPRRAEGFVIRDVQKDYGLKRIVEGYVGPDAPVFLIDDVLTTGGSILKAAAALHAAHGVKPEAVFILVDREEGGVESLKQVMSCEVRSVLKVSDFAVEEPVTCP
jgi:orotate phosphoribosyltransferase